MPNKSQQSTSIGPSSHRSPSSPLPADALEYFSETAARMGSSGASGMMIQSPDGRPAGIFFQPKSSSNLGTRTPGSLNVRRASTDERFSIAATANQNRVMNGGGVSSNGSGSNESSARASPLVRDQSDISPKASKPSLLISECSKEQEHQSSKSSKSESSSDSALQITSPTSPASPSKSKANGGSSISRLTKQPTIPNAQAGSTIRPSAQPQAGLLIGAGFTPSNKKGVGPKKVSANMEILPPIKVLIVEDNEINVKILSKFLKERKIQFGVANNGREAVDQWQSGGYHLILMDIQLPVMDGIEATKEIRRLERGANIGPINSTTPPALASSTSGRDSNLMPPAGSTSQESKSTGLMSPSTMLNNLKASVIIVALTASILNSDRVAALAAGCNDFLNKPVNMRWLERKVIEWGSMQYLIGFRDVNDDVKRQRRYHQSLTAREISESNGLVEQGFGSGPDRLAKEMAGRLHIGAKKVK